jgi:hypothetical protein
VAKILSQDPLKPPSRATKKSHPAVLALARAAKSRLGRRRRRHRLLSERARHPEWTCTADGNAFCSASGTGAIVDAVYLPAGDAVTYTVTCYVDPPRWWSARR